MQKVALIKGSFGEGIRIEDFHYHDSTGDPLADSLRFYTDNARHCGGIEMGINIVTLTKEQIEAIRDQCNRALGE
jgi:hypothetical protein